MERHAISPARNWTERAAAYGFDFHTDDDGATYWDESVAYSFSLEEIERDIEDPSGELHQMCLAAAHKAANDERLMKALAIPEAFFDLVRESLRRDDGTLYGRFDLCYDGRGPAKLFEYNADTPTSLYEAGVFQWAWLEESIADGVLPEGSDQYNSIHDKLIDRFMELNVRGPMHFAALLESLEDRATVAYLGDCALQAGIDVSLIDMTDIGIDAAGRFTDLQDGVIANLFKLYPWEFMVRDTFGEHLLKDQTRIIEPAWKMLLSNKGLLPILWDMFPGHPNLLEAYFDTDPRARSLQLRDHVRKPLLSREGANIEIVQNGSLTSTDGQYGDEGFVVQALAPLPSFDGFRPVLGAWIVGDKPAGLGMREEHGPVTANKSRFVPHFIAPR